GFLVDEARSTPNQIDAAALEVAGIDVVEPGDIAVPRVLQLRPVVAVRDDVKAIVPGVLDVVSMLRAVPHYLLRHAADIDAGSTQRAVFDDGCSYSVFRRPLCMCKAAAAAAEYQQIEFNSHQWSPISPVIIPRLHLLLI